MEKTQKGRIYVSRASWEGWIRDWEARADFERRLRQAVAAIFGQRLRLMRRGYLRLGR